MNLASDPEDDNSPADVDALEFCKETKSDVLKTVNGSYELMLQNIGAHGNPPW